MGKGRDSLARRHRLATRLIIGVGLPGILLLGAFTAAEQSRSERALRAEMAEQGRSVARTLRFAVQQALANDRRDEAHRLVDEVAGQGRMLGARLYDRQGAVQYQTPSLSPYPPIHHDALRSVLREGTSRDTHRMLDEAPVITFILPIFGEKGVVVGAIQLVQLESAADAAVRASRNAVLTLMLLLGLLLAATILVVTHVAVTQPVEALIARFRRAAEGDLSSRMAPERPDELGLLAEEFNGLCERLELAQTALAAENDERRRSEMRMANAERLASLGVLSAGLAHALGNPLQVLGGMAETARSRRSVDAEVARDMSVMLEQVDRMRRIIQHMVDFARMPKPILTPTAVEPVVRDALAAVEHRCVDAGIAVKLEIEHALPKVRIDGGQIQQVIYNLASNAIDAMPHGGKLHVAVMRAEASRNDVAPPELCIAISVEDSGIGIPPERLQRILMPFFTTKGSGAGTGLGLSVCDNIIREHRGWLRVVSEPGRRTCATIYLLMAGATERARSSAVVT